MYEPDLQYVTGDMHPDYASTAYGNGLAETRGIPFLGVQHHWAHMLSCMAENAVESPALGVVWDGTGYGLDGTIWGGEFLLTTNEGFRRAAHFRTFPLPGGDAAIRKPYHAAAGALYEIFGDDAFTGRESSLLRQMLAKGFRSPRTSSVGRLFDAVASIAGVRDQVSFEGQAAMELEFVLQPNVSESYDYVVRPGEPLIVDWEPMIREIVRDARNGVECGIISSRFHNTLVSIVIDVAQRIGELRVVLTGGCFQNRYLTEQTVQRLSEAGFSVYWHQRIPPNDGGISLGQVIAASHMQRQENLCVLQSQAK
jgi:hydrogenase maturation protein HypF